MPVDEATVRAAVVGGGAMGATLAAEATAAGLRVSVVDVAGEVVRRMNEHGVVVERTANGRSDRLLVKVHATTDPGSLRPVDVAFVFVKAHHTRVAADAVAALCGPETVVVTLQNGWGNADVLASVLPPDRLVMGVTYQSSSAVGPGHARHTGSGPTVVGPYRRDADGGAVHGAERVAAFLTAAGWPAEVSGDVPTEIWKKLVLNAATLPTAALTRQTAGDLATLAPMRELVDALAVEAVEVARAQGMPIDPAERIARIQAVLAGAGGGKPSMLQDVEARRMTEIDVVNGAVVAEGRRLGIDTPLNRAMVALVHGLERSWAA